jgi:hypothetical protein
MMRKISYSLIKDLISSPAVYVETAETEQASFVVERIANKLEKETGLNYIRKSNS